LGHNGLSKVALGKAQDMYKNKYFDHNSPTFGSPFDMMKKFGVSFKAAGENIANGQTSPQQVMNDWMNSDSEGQRRTAKDSEGQRRTASQSSEQQLYKNRYRQY
jgi:uncharacterized protein YkwD